MTMEHAISTLTCSDKYGSFFRMLCMIRLGDEAPFLHVILRHKAHVRYLFVSKVRVLFPLERLKIETSGTSVVHSIRIPRLVIGQ